MITAQVLMCLVLDTGKVVEIGTLMTMGTDRELDGRDTEVMAGWDREDAGNNHIQGAM
jgi:hypothetical protein